jgi:hypothetical protein
LWIALVARNPSGRFCRKREGGDKSSVHLTLEKDEKEGNFCDAPGCKTTGTHWRCNNVNESGKTTCYFDMCDKCYQERKK